MAKQSSDNVINQLLEKLETHELKKRLFDFKGTYDATIDRFIQFQTECRERFDNDEAGVDEETADEIRKKFFAIGDELTTLDQDMEEAIQKSVISQFDQPLLVTAKEITSEYKNVFKIKFTDDIEIIHDIFLMNVKDRLINDTEIGPFPVARVILPGPISYMCFEEGDDYFLPGSDVKQFLEKEEVERIISGVLWQKNGVILQLCGTGPTDKTELPDFTSDKLLYAQISGKMSHGQSDVFQNEFPSIVRSVLHTLDLLNKDSRRSESVFLEKYPYLDVKYFSGERSFFCDCLDSYFITPSNKDTTAPDPHNNHQPESTPVYL